MSEMEDINRTLRAEAQRLNRLMTEGHLGTSSGLNTLASVSVALAAEAMVGEAKRIASALGRIEDAIAKITDRD